MKKQRKRIYAALLCSCLMLSLVYTPVLAAETEQAANTHQHTEACYTWAKKCIHKHSPECYPQESGCITKELKIKSRKSKPQKIEARRIPGISEWEEDKNR